MKFGSAFVTVVAAMTLGSAALIKEPPAFERKSGGRQALPGLPAPESPAVPNSAGLNRSSAEKLALGQTLFFDVRLSRNDRVSCATCHDPAKGFSNGQRFAAGVDGKIGTRNVPSLINVSTAGSLFWDGRAATLEEQALAPIENPLEMDRSPTALAEKLNGIGAYQKQFQDVYGGAATPERIAEALAAFERSLVSLDTPFDQHRRGESDALSEQSRRGMTLFFGQARCSVCHREPNLSDDQFHNIGTADGPDDVGRRTVTNKETDHGAFRTPQLREIGITAPYMHNGRFRTLTEVVHHYNFGGVTDEQNDYRDIQLQVLYLNEEQEDDLVAFLAEGLTSLKVDRRTDSPDAALPLPR